MRKLAYSPGVSSLLGDNEVRQALICSECGVCEVYACPMGLAPRRINVHIKDEMAKAGVRYQKPSGTFHQLEERSHRRAPTGRIAYRLGVEKYYDYRIDTLKELEPSAVKIPLKQHIGQPSTPVVRPGESVTCGQLIGALPDGSLGANIHASISGTVTRVDQSIVIERGQA